MPLISFSYNYFKLSVCRRGFKKKKKASNNLVKVKKRQTDLSTICQQDREIQLMQVRLVFPVDSARPHIQPLLFKQGTEIFGSLREGDSFQLLNPS